jgi:hypothetical protein
MSCLPILISSRPRWAACSIDFDGFEVGDRADGTPTRTAADSRAPADRP